MGQLPAATPSQAAATRYAWCFTLHARRATALWVVLGSSLPGSFSDNVVLVLPAPGPPKPPIQDRHASAERAGEEGTYPENLNAQHGMTGAAAAAGESGDVVGGHATGAGADEDSTQGVGGGVRRCFYTDEDLGPTGGADAFRAALSVQDLHTQQCGGGQEGRTARNENDGGQM